MKDSNRDWIFLKLFFYSNKNEITADALKSISLFILAGPQQKFNEIELESMKDYVNSGGSLMVLLAESGENAFDTNINFLLEEFGMNINSDSVVRQHYYKYFHPKEAVLNGCIVCENMNNELLKVIKKSGVPSMLDEKCDLELVYPFGATINVISPSNTLITTSTIAYPFNRPVCGYFSNDNGGQILAIGSGHVFTDKYIVNEHNMYIWDYFVTLLVEKSIKFKAKDFNDVEVCRLNNMRCVETYPMTLRFKTTQQSPTSCISLINRRFVSLSHSIAIFLRILRSCST